MASATAHNTANNDTRSFDMAEERLSKKINCARSTVLFKKDLSFDSSQNGGVVCRNDISLEKEENEQ
ncbi:MAG: hypothetical protein NTX44_07680 [Ignavibacteriales bacterium]|nr:hypothetical protein [Ignavibacteriales bacterium]